MNKKNITKNNFKNLSKNGLSYCPAEVKIKDGNKYYKSKRGYNKLKPSESYNKYGESKEEYFMVMLNNEYVVYDTDCKASYDIMEAIMRKLNIKDNKTPSYSNINKGLTYKNHYFFKIKSPMKKIVKMFIPSKENEVMNNMFVDLDVIPGYVIENREKILEIDFKNLPYLPQVLMELYTYNLENKNKLLSECEKYESLLNLLNDSRADDYESWRNVLMAIKNDESIIINKYDLIHKFSKRSKKYNKNEVNKFYDNINKPSSGGLKVGTICNMAREDNPSGFKSWSRKYNNKELDSENSYEKMKIEFEKNNFFLVEEAKYCSITKEGSIIRKTRTDFNNTYEDLRYERINSKGEIKNMSFTTKWHRDRTKKKYRKTDFYPKIECPSDIYNIFNGLEIERRNPALDKEFINSSIYNHFKLMANNDEKIFNYMMMWFSNRIKNPADKPIVAIVIKGEEGSGKSKVFDWIGNKIIGKDYYIQSQAVNHIFGDFNPHLENKLLIVINEMKSKFGTLYKEQIKEAITDDIVDINRKNKDQTRVRNSAGFIFLTNNFNVIRASKNDRRFLFVEMDSSKAKNQPYFDKLLNDMKSGEYDKSFYNYLMSLDSENFDFINNRPETEYSKDIQLLNSSPLEKFILELYEDGKLKQEYKNKEILGLYKEWLLENGMDCKITMTKFSIDFKRVGIYEQTRTSRFRGYRLIQSKLDELLKKYDIESFDDLEFSDEEKKQEYTIPVDL